MTDELKQILTDCKSLLMRNDFDGVYKKVANNRSLCKDLTEFLYNIAKIDPLPYMKTIPYRMFYGVTLNNELVIPQNISFSDESFVYSLTAPAIRIKSELGSRMIRDSVIKNIYFDSPSEKIPSMCLDDCRVEKIFIPETVLRIGSNALLGVGSSEVKIITPYRDDPAKRLVVPKSEISWYKDHLKFKHAPKAESEAEDAVTAN